MIRRFSHIRKMRWKWLNTLIKIKGMNKEAIKNKLFYFICLGAMTFFLVFVADFFFLREANIDVTSNVQISYTGVNGNATAEVMETAGDINQRTQALLDTVNYTVEPNTGLSNGDTILVSASYDEKIAAQYHYNVINVQKEIIVEGLSDRYPNIASINEEYLADMQSAADQYVDNNIENIFLLEYEEYDVRDWNEEDSQCVYSAFMSSNNSPSGDRMIYIYQLDYHNEENEDQESEEPSVLTVYYLVCIPNVNDSDTVDEQNIFGERVYFTETERAELNFEAYANRVFGRSYTIEAIPREEPEDQQTEEDTKEEEPA